MSTRTFDAAPAWRALFVTLALGLALLPSPITQAMPGPGSRPAVPTEAGTALPPAAQAAISGALGRDDEVYHAHGRGKDLAAGNPRQGFSAQFGREVVQISAGTARFGLGYSGHGRGADLVQGHAVAPEASANRVEYRRRDLTEWWVNGPLGLEQGFTVNHAPAGRGPLDVVLSLSGDLSAEIDLDRKGLSLRRSDGTMALRYAGLVANDASGRPLPAWIELDGARLSLRVDDTGARYPVIVDPLVQQAKLTASTGAADDTLGYSIAVDGDTVVVGVPFRDTGGKKDHGSAYVFVKPAVGWATTSTISAELDDNNGKAQGDLFGASVAIQGDTIFVGAPVEDTKGGSPNQGAVRVFTKPAGGWTGIIASSAKLIASDKATGDQLGSSVAVVGDTVVAGAKGDDGGRGSAYVYVKPAAGWSGNVSENAKLTASDGTAGDTLGSAVAVGGDTILAGAPTDSGGGSAYVFDEPVGGWSGSLAESARLIASDGASVLEFGRSMAMSGSTAVIGAAGSAYVFTTPQGAGAAVSRRMPSSPPPTCFRPTISAIRSPSAAMPSWSGRTNKRSDPMRSRARLTCSASQPGAGSGTSSSR